jgi:hypothetical protein
MSRHVMTVTRRVLILFTLAAGLASASIAVAYSQPASTPRAPCRHGAASVRAQYEKGRWIVSRLGVSGCIVAP